MKNRLLTGLCIALAAVLGIQGFYLYKMSQRIDTLESDQAVAAAAPDNFLQLPKTPLNMGQWDPGSWNPYKDLRRMQDNINHLFGNMFTRFQGSKQFGDLFGSSLASPLLDMKDTGSKFVFKVNIPGADASKINVSIDQDRVLHIDATTSSSEKGRQGIAGNMLRSERFSGEYQRTVRLPEPVDSSSLHSDYRHGVLTVTVNKRHSIS